MSQKIYLSPSNQECNNYAYGNTNEMEQCNKIAEAAEKALKRCGFEVKRAAKGQEMRKSIQESNRWGADLHLCIHTNAGGGNGTMCMVYRKSTDNMKFASPIYRAVQGVTPGKIDYGVREMPELAELNSTHAIAVYTEVDFHDNRSIAKWLTENSTIVGEAFAKGVCSAYSVQYKASISKSNHDSKKLSVKGSLYRVQVGAFQNRKNAEEVLKKVQSAGFADAFIQEQK